MTRAIPALLLVAVVGCGSEEIEGEADATEEDMTAEDVSVDCDESKMASYYLAADPWGIDSHCDEVGVCIIPGASVEITDLFPDARCDDPRYECSDDDSCLLFYHGRITTEQWINLCELSLRSGVHYIYCAVYGP